MADANEWYSPGSGLWEHFERKKTGEGRCRICQKQFKSANVTTLRYHAESQHRIVIPKLFSKAKASENATLASEKAASASTSASTKPVTTQPSVKTLWEAKEKDSIGLVLSRLAAVDGIAFARISNS